MIKCLSQRDAKGQMINVAYMLTAMNLKMPEDLPNSILQGRMHWVYSQIELRMKLRLIHTSCTKNWIMLLTSLSLGSLDHKL